MILLCKGTNFSLCCGLFIPGVKICTKNVSQVNQAEQHHSGVILKNYSYYFTFSIPDHCLARISMLTIMVHEDGPLEQHDSECKFFAIFHHQKNCFPTNIFNFDLDFELLSRGSYLIDWRYVLNPPWAGSLGPKNLTVRGGLTPLTPKNKITRFELCFLSTVVQLSSPFNWR